MGPNWNERKQQMEGKAEKSIRPWRRRRLIEKCHETCGKHCTLCGSPAHREPHPAASHAPSALSWPNPTFQDSHTPSFNTPAPLQQPAAPTTLPQSKFVLAPTSRPPTTHGFWCSLITWSPTFPAAAPAPYDATRRIVRARRAHAQGPDTECLCLHRQPLTGPRSCRELERRQRAGRGEKRMIWSFDMIWRFLQCRHVFIRLL